MLITSKTKYAEFQPYEEAVQAESVEELKRAAEQEFKPCHKLTLDEFWGCLSGNFEILGDMTEPSVLQVYWLKRFTDFCETFTKTCERLMMQDADAEAMQAGCVEMQPQESMLIFVREYFGLPSFVEAGRVTIGEYILARKDRYNGWRQRKNYEAKQLRELKRKKK